MDFRKANPFVCLVVVGLGAPAFASTITHVSTNWVSSSNNGGNPVFDVSVESAYAGYKGTYDDGGGAPGAESSAAFNGPVVAYRFWASSSTAISTLTQSGGIIGDLTTTDTAFQNSSFLRLWETTASNGNAFDTTPDYNSGVTTVNNLDQGASGSIDISAMTAGSVYFIYGAYRATPVINVSMGATDLGDLHNGDYANGNEFYIAQVDFVNDGDQTTIDWSLPAGSNDRWSGIIVTNTVPEPATLGLLAIGGLMMIQRRRA